MILISRSIILMLSIMIMINTYHLAFNDGEWWRVLFGLVGGFGFCFIYTFEVSHNNKEK